MTERWLHRHPRRRLAPTPDTLGPSRRIFVKGLAMGGAAAGGAPPQLRCDENGNQTARKPSRGRDGSEPKY